MTAPKLRFNGFNTNYQQIKLGNIMNEDIKNGTQNKEGINKNYIKFINVINLYSPCIKHSDLSYIDKDINKIRHLLVNKGDLFYTRSSIAIDGIAHCNIFNDDYFPVTFDDHIMRVRIDKNIASPEFIRLYSISNSARKYFKTAAKTTTMTTIGQGELKNLNISLPELKEQEKISLFFKKLNKKIQFQQEKIKLMKEQKKGYLHKIFNQELRFKNVTGHEYAKWELVKLSHFAKKIIKKNTDLGITNVISNSARNGLISQKDYFDKEIANQENINGYYVITKGDFVYNPRISSDAPYGPINIYKGSEPGIVSPLYMCFTTENIHKEFIYYYFKSTAWYKYIYMHGDSGARHDRVSIKDSTFLEMPISVPCKEEQSKIADFFLQFDNKINAEEMKMVFLQEQKRALMQQMFI